MCICLTVRNLGQKTIALLDVMPIAVYAIDALGSITFYKEAAVDAGSSQRTQLAPVLAKDGNPMCNSSSSSSLGLHDPEIYMKNLGHRILFLMEKICASS